MSTIESIENKYVKAIYNGDIIEFFIMDKPPPKAYQIHEEEKEVKEDSEWIHEAQQDRKLSRREQTLRDARNTMRRLAVRNFKAKNALFVTLTYGYHLTDIDTADKHFRDFVGALREESGQSFHYIAVREFTKAGRVHFHMLTDFRIDGDMNDSEEIDLRRWERDIAKVWGKGFVDIKVTSHIDNVGAYLSKYMSKEIGSDYFFRNKKYYLCSQGLLRPEVLKGDTAKDLYRAMNEKSEVYTNSYESEYLGTIRYIEYNLKRVYHQYDIS